MPMQRVTASDAMRGASGRGTDTLVGIIAEKHVPHRLFPTLEDLRNGMATVDLGAMMGQYGDVLKLKVAEVPKRLLVAPLPVM